MVAAEWWARTRCVASPLHLDLESVGEYGLICGVVGHEEESCKYMDPKVGHLLVTIIVFPFKLFLHGAFIFAFLFLLILRLDNWRIKRV